MIPGDPWHYLELKLQYEQEMAMPRIHEMIESKYLKKEDLVDGEMVVTVAKIGKGNVALEDQPPEMKWMVRFAEVKKPMVLNSTNIQLMAKVLASEDTDDWIGKQVALYVDDNVSFGGKLVGGIRVRAAKKRSTSIDDLESDIPFKRGSADGIDLDDVPF